MNINIKNTVFVDHATNNQRGLAIHRFTRLGRFEGPVSLRRLKFITVNPNWDP